jgi:acetyltransferase
VVRVPSDRLVRFLTHVDYDRHLALVCVAPREAGEEIVGEARYVVNEGAKSCDFAVIIADDWHKSGIAGLLMSALIGAARGRGPSAMESQVLSWNAGMLRFARGLGFTVEHMAGDPGTLRIVKKL